MRAAFSPIVRVILLACGWLLAGAGAGLTACASAAPATPVGVSTALAEAPAPVKAEQPLLPWPHFAAARAWPEAAPAVAALAHRRDGTLVRVRVEPPALESYRALARHSPMPDGASVAAFHESPAGELLGVYVLEKRAGAWAALELDAAGARLPNDGSACLRCHDLAPTDHLFGITSRAPGHGATSAGELNDAPPR